MRGAQTFIMGGVETFISIIIFIYSMEYKQIERLFKSHNEARDYLGENPELLISGSELVQVEFKVIKGAVDILLKKDDIFYFVEVKDKGSLYSARQQLCRYGRMFERFSPLFQDKELKYIVVKIQKYLGTDIYVYDNLDDILSLENTNKIHLIHYKKNLEVRKLPEVIEKTLAARTDPKNRRKWKKNMKAGMKKYYKENPLMRAGMRPGGSTISCGDKPKMTGKA